MEPELRSREVKSRSVASFKAVADAEPGTVEALVSVFGNVDEFGDRMVPGCFERSLEERGLPYFVWAHEWHTVPIGVVKSAEETDAGLVVTARLFVGDDEDHPVARQVYTAMRALDGKGAPALREFSFGFQTVGSRYVTEDEREIRELTDVELFEVGPCLVGMNPATQLLGVKSALSDLKNLPGGNADEGDHADKPDDNDGEKLSEDQKARIGALIAAHPMHLPPKGLIP
jgi:HK97 family phage prohead protease